MDSASISSYNINEIVKALLFQQFYYGGDEIVGRAKDISITIPGVGILLTKFLNHLTRITNLMFTTTSPRKNSNYPSG